MTTKTMGFTSILQDSKTTLGELEAYRKEPVSGTKRNLVALGLGIGGFALVGMFALQIITGVIAAIVAVAGGVGLYFGSRYVKALDPVIRQHAKNMEIDLQKKEARRNAVAQLDNMVIKNRERLVLARSSRDKLGAQVESLSNDAEKSKGKANYEKKMAVVQRLKNAYDTVCNNVDKGAEANKVFEEKVADYKDMQNFADAAGEAMDMLNSAGGEKLDDILALESFEAIEDEFNTALISIENSTRDVQLDMGE